jgi:hypothetical protein
MRSRNLGVASLAALMVAAVSCASPAAAQTADQTVKQTVKKKPSDTPARVTVQKRSFLDAGVEVKPGQRKFTDYAFPPGYSPTYSIDFTSGNVRGPLVGPWDTSRNNFWPW